MEDSLSQYPDPAENPEKELKQDEIERQTAERGEIVANSGVKIKDLADKAIIVGGIGSLILGFLIWIRSENLVGLLSGLLAVVIGLFGSYVLAALLRGWGDMVANSFEQTKILRRLEEQSFPNLPKRERPEDGGAGEKRVRPAAADTEPDEPDRNETEEAKLLEIGDETEEEPEEEPRDELSDAQQKNLALSRKLKMPLHGIVDRRMRRVAHFAERSRHGIICPICGRRQDSDRNNCFFCDCRFVYDDEPFMIGDDDVLDRLRRTRAK